MRFSLLAIWALALTACKKPASTSEYSTARYNGLNFTADHPSDWKVVAYEDNPNDARIEFDFPGPGFATVIVFHPENEAAIERYIQLAAKNFPRIHEKDHPEQKVTTLGACERTTLGSFDALTTRFSVFVAPRQVECSFTYVDLTTSDAVMILDAYDEGTRLSSAAIESLERFIASIRPKKQHGEQGGADQSATASESKPERDSKPKPDPEVRPQ